MKRFTLFSLITVLLMSCHTGKTSAESNSLPMTAPVYALGPKAIVYKTTNDYSRLVPVQMNESRTEIVSYPAPEDVFFRGEPAYPTPLDNGYWLDNRGIGPNSAFLNYTYEEYSRLKQTPTKAELMERIVDKNPFIEIWNCGLRSAYTNEVAELNERIRSDFKDCKNLVNKTSEQKKAN